MAANIFFVTGMAIILVLVELLVIGEPVPVGRWPR